MNEETTQPAPLDQPSEEQGQALATNSEQVNNDPEEVKALVKKLFEGVPIAEGAKKEITQRLVEKREFRHELMMGFIDRGNQSISPETAKILAESADKENDNKFKYLMKRADLEEAESQREHDRNKEEFQTKTKFAWAIGWVIVTPVIISGLVTLFWGIHLCTIGKDTLGAALITAVISGALSFLAGIGVADFFKKNK